MKTITVEELVSNGKITRKTYNILVRARLRTVFDLVRYKSGLPRLFRTYTSCINEVNSLLDEIEGTGRITEMTNLLFPPEPELSKGEEMLAKISEEQMEYLEVVYKQQVELLAMAKDRASIRLAKVLSSIPAQHFIRDYLLEDDDRIRMMGEIREASVNLIGALKKRLNEEIEWLSHPEMPLQYKLLMLHAEGLLDDDDFALDYYKKNGHLPVLYLLQKYIINNKDVKTFKAFLQRYDIFGGKIEVDRTPLDKSSFTITSYSNTIFDALFSHEEAMEPIGKFIDELLAAPANTSYLQQRLEGDFICEDSECITDFIAEEQLILQPLCVVALLGKWMKGEFVCLGGYTRNLGSAMEGRWTHAYLVRRSVMGDVDMEKELWYFRDNIINPSTEEYTLDMEDYVAERGYGQNPPLANVFKRVMADEMNLTINEDGLLVVPKKKDKALVDRLFIHLDRNKLPMTLDQLTEAINTSGGRRYVRASISLALNKDERFQGSGKKGCYALSEWQLPFFGSNAEIVYQVLEETGRPMKGDEIVAYLTKYDYNKQFSKGDLASVFLFGKDKFVKLGPSLYGLVGRHYPGFETTTPANEQKENTPASPMTAYDAAEITEQGDTLSEHLEPPVSAEPESPASEKPETPVSSTSDSPASEKPETTVSAESESPVSENPESPVSAGLETPSQTETASSEDKQEPINEEEGGASQILYSSIGMDVETPIVPLFEDAMPENDVEWSWMCSNVREFVIQNKREPLEMFTAEVDLASWLQAQKEAMHKQLLTEGQIKNLLDIRNLLW